MKESILKHWNNKELPYGVRVLTFITSIHWIGWGFAETLIPVLLYTFSHSFAQAGLLQSGYDVALILALPIVGIMADRKQSTTIILIGFFIYLFVGASYFLAGITRVVIFIILARLLNGIAYSFDSVGRETYFMRHTEKARVASTFGYFDTIANFWWIVAALIGIFLIKYFSIATILFLVTPSSLICIFLLLHFRNKKPENIQPTIERKSNKILLKEFKSWNQALKSITIFNFFIVAIGGMVTFFIPIEVYKNGAKLDAVIILGVIAAVPALLGWDLGKWFDIKGTKVFTTGLISFALLLFAIAFFKKYVWLTALYFAINVILELLSVGSMELVTLHTKPEYFGKVDAIIKSVEYIGGLTGPIIGGIIMDKYGIGITYVLSGMIMIMLAIIFHFLRKRGYIKEPIILVGTIFQR